MPLLEVTAVRPAAEDTWLFELREAGGGALAPFTAGAHVEVATPAGIRRKYSLCNDPAETDRYVIAVKREAAGRGGSADLVDRARPGDRLEVGEPRNAFELDEKARDFLFLAGGIGITPIMAMLRRCAALDARFRLVYLTRSPAHTAFRDELSQPPFAGRVTFHHDGGDPGRALDLWPLFEKPTREHVYCCGPRAMLEEVRAMTGHWAPAAIHFESFIDAASGAKADDRPFTVVLARSGERIDVPVGVSILEAMRARGHAAASSCEAGTCGTCKTRLVAGEPDHRDLVLEEHERATHVMICVSRARSAELVVDR